MRLAAPYRATPRLAPTRHATPDRQWVAAFGAPVVGVPTVKRAEPFTTNCCTSGESCMELSPYSELLIASAPIDSAVGLKLDWNAAAYAAAYGWKKWA